MDKKLAELLNPILEDLGFEMVRVRLSSGDPSTCLLYTSDAADEV